MSGGPGISKNLVLKQLVRFVMVLLVQYDCKFPQRHAELISGILEVFDPGQVDLQDQWQSSISQMTRDLQSEKK